MLEPSASQNPHPTPTDRFEWERLVRRVRLGSSTKLVAAVLATYADPDGSRIRPGVERLTNVTGLSERSIKYALKKLRDMGLIQQVRRGGRTGDGRAYATIYRLTIPADYLTIPGVLSVDETPEPQRATGAPQRATDDTSTCNGLHPTNHLPTQDQPVVTSGTKLLTARDDSGAKVIPLTRRGDRR